MPIRRRVCQAMALSGALCGLAGALLVLGTEHRYPGVFRTGYGFDGIAVALIGGATAPGVVGAGVVFGALRAGATRLQLIGIHPSFAELIQGIAVLLVAAPRLFAVRSTFGSRSGFRIRRGHRERSVSPAAEWQHFGSPMR